MINYASHERKIKTQIIAERNNIVSAKEKQQKKSLKVCNK
jgi:hypothetical protein